MAPRAPLPPAGECLGGLSVGAGQQPLASVRPGQIHVTIHTHTHTWISWGRCPSNRSNRNAATFVDEVTGVSTVA